MDEAVHIGVHECTGNIDSGNIPTLMSVDETSQEQSLR
jgi:hypothetical protein